MPLLHCRVSFITSSLRTSSRLPISGATPSSKRPTMDAMTARASMSARFCPMQSRGPAGEAQAAPGQARPAHEGAGKEAGKQTAGAEALLHSAHNNQQVKAGKHSAHPRKRAGRSAQGC